MRLSTTTSWPFSVNARASSVPTCPLPPANGLPPGIAGDLVYAIFELSDPNAGIFGNCFQDNSGIDPLTGLGDPNQLVNVFLADPNAGCP